MEVIDGNRIASEIVAELKAEVSGIKGRKPCIALVRVGDDPASVSYVKKKGQIAAEIGIESRVLLPPVTIPQGELEGLVESLNDDDGVDGILVQSPLPDGLDERAVFGRIAPEKDVDGFSPINLGKLVQEDSTGFAACSHAARLSSRAGTWSSSGARSLSASPPASLPSRRGPERTPPSPSATRRPRTSPRSRARRTC
jgi:methylenetetrahydrofolate dehydrogenase (NADP+)/methenyltetrahydrofolate cyclohydrolase